MSKVKTAINKYASEEDKPILLWLLHQYNWSSQFNFVAKVFWVRDGPSLLDSHMEVKPTQEGYLLYKYRNELKVKL